jgi:hypothetical protein
MLAVDMQDARQQASMAVQASVVVVLTAAGKFPRFSV